MLMLLDIGGPGAAARFTQPSRETPLHCAVRSTIRKHKPPPGVGEAAILIILEECPQSASQRSSPEYGSRTPLHLACTARAPVSIITMLYNADPEAARTACDAAGRTALQVAKTHWLLWHPKWRWKVASVLKGSNENNIAATEWVEPVIEIGNPSEEESSQKEIRRVAAGEECMKEDDLCVFCWDEQADHVLVPCGHMCLCKKCSMGSVLRASLQSRCPVYKGHVVQAVRVFRSGVPNPE